MTTSKNYNKNANTKKKKRKTFKAQKGGIVKGKKVAKRASVNDSPPPSEPIQSVKDESALSGTVPRIRTTPEYSIELSDLR